MCYNISIMIKKPLVAVVGRPNVGKSTFFNKICGKRISIVKDTPGVTRDRIYADAEWSGYSFTLVDTGGIELKSEDTMFKHIRAQAEIAMELADVILFFVDAKAGLVSSDYDVAEILRHTKKPVLLVVNKLDNFDVAATYDFFSLGLGTPHPISCEQMLGLGDLLDEVVALFPKRVETEEEFSLKIAVVGRPNVGKSSIVNRLLGAERVIVSDVAGTTRDAVDTPFTYMGRSYTIIDTAGMRRKRSIENESVEDYSVMRTVSAIDRADVVLIVFDSSEEITEQDVRIAGYVNEQGKPCVLIMNKWDKVEKDAYTIDKLNAKIDKDLAFMHYFETLYISAATGQRTDKIIPAVDLAFVNSSQRVATGVLNEVVSEAVSMTEPPSRSGRRLKILYVTQPEAHPPHFVFFVNDDKLVHFSYRRYLENSIRKAFDFTGTPIKLSFVPRKEG